ncbi:MAG: division/cell wall cluster transcriptional repressor MraZ [Desulfovibrionaceae bacterium]|nr:division/cell wall cluster transcriptional repressor MraZ [Desulfovibrionaceae bacterium]
MAFVRNIFAWALATVLDSPRTLGHKVGKRGKLCSLAVEYMDGLFNKSFCRSLDAKARLLLPPEYKTIFAEENEAGSFVLAHKDTYLVAYRPSQWQAIQEALLSVRNPSPNMNIFMAKFLGLAETVTPDQQGRVRIPQPLLRAAGITKDVQLVGMLRTFHIWDQALFDAAQPADITSELAAQGITVPF